MAPAYAAVPPAGEVHPAAWSPDDVPSAAREAAVALAALVVLGLVGYGLTLDLHVGNLHNGALALVNTAVGLYVLRARPGHRLGRLFAAVGLVSGVMYFGRQYALHRPTMPGADWLAWVSIWPVPIAMMLVGWAVLLFPTGQPLSPRWRAAGRAMTVAAVVLALSSALWPIEDNWTRDGLTFPLSVGGTTLAQQVFSVALPVAYLSFLALWAAAVAFRSRRAAPEELHQLRWFGYAVFVVLGLMAGGLAVAGTPLPGQLATPLIPLAAGVAMLRYRLYDIDPIINKTVVVAAMATLVTLGYVVVVAGAGVLVPAGSPLLPLLATAAVAVAFEPVRRRAQRFADRLVHGPRATPYEALSQLSARLDAPPDDVLAGLCATVARAVGATEVTLWVGEEEELRPAAAYPTAPDPDQVVSLGALRARHPGTTSTIARQGRTLGALVVRPPRGERPGPAQRRLLADLVGQAGLVIEYRARLREVAEQAEELRGAARRVVTAQDEARRRLERDLHDGAQHRLVTLALELGEIARYAVSTGDQPLRARAEEARQHLLEATAELRELARGLHPAVLTHDGLVAAVASLVDGAAVPVTLEVAVDRRLPPELEAAAYFVVAEALTNAARHSGTEEVHVRLEDRDGLLVVEVADRGAGGAGVAAGGGLQGLADRLAALGARLVLDSPPGGGTVVRATISCG